MNGLVTL